MIITVYILLTFKEVPRLRSRLNWPLIITCQTKPTSDQNAPDWSVLWFHYRVLKALCAFKLHSITSSDQTIVRSIAPPIKLVCARIRLWSDWKAPEITSDQTKVRSKLSMIRLNCALIRLRCIRNSLVRKWFEHEQIFQSCYNIFISWNLVFAIIYSTKEKSNLKVANEEKTQVPKEIIEYAIYSCFWLNRWIQTALHKNVLIYSDSKSFYEGTSSCYQLDTLVQINSIRLAMPFLRCWFLAETAFVSKKNLRKKPD